MTFAKVATLAIDALKERRKVFCVEANMYWAGIQSPATERAKDRYMELTEAIEELRELAKRPE